MRVRVETFAGEGGFEMARRIHFDGRCVEVAENFDRWHGPDYRYFKVRGGDGDFYILRLDEGSGEWSLTLFQSAHAEEGPVPPLSGKGRSPTPSA